MTKYNILFYLIFYSIFFAPICFAFNNEDINIHGFISQGYLLSDRDDFLADTDQGTFEFNEMGIVLSMQNDSKFHMGLQLFSRDLGDFGNNEITVDWCYGDYRLNDWIGFRFGQMKSPFGFFNETRDIDMLRPFIILPQSVYKESWRDSFVATKGIGVYGGVSIPHLGRMNYQLVTGKARVPIDGGIAHYFERYGWGDVDDIKDPDSHVLQLIWETPLNGFRLGGSMINSKLEINAISNNSYVWGDLRLATDIYKQFPSQLSQLLVNYGIQPIDADKVALASRDALINGKIEDDSWPKKFKQEYEKMTFYLISSEYSLDKLNLAYEYMFVHLSDKRFLLENNLLLEHTNPWYMEGFYGSLTYRITDRLEFGTYYSVFYFDKNDKSGTIVDKYHSHEYQCISLEDKYVQTSEMIQEQVIASLSQQYPTLQIADSDIKRILIRPTYQLKKITYPNHMLWLKDWAISFRFDMNDNWSIKLEGHFMDGSEFLEFKDLAESPNQTRFLFAAKTTFHF